MVITFSTDYNCTTAYTINIMNTNIYIHIIKHTYIYKLLYSTLLIIMFFINLSCAGSYHLSSLVLSSSISMTSLNRLGPASFSSLALLSCSVSTTILSCLLSTTFSSLRLLSKLLASPHFNILRVDRRCLL